MLGTLSFFLLAFLFVPATIGFVYEQLSNAQRRRRRRHREMVESEAESPEPLDVFARAGAEKREQRRLRSLQRMHGMTQGDSPPQEHLTPKLTSKMTPSLRKSDSLAQLSLAENAPTVPKPPTLKIARRDSNPIKATQKQPNTVKNNTAKHSKPPVFSVSAEAPKTTQAVVSRAKTSKATNAVLQPVPVSSQAVSALSTYDELAHETTLVESPARLRQLNERVETLSECGQLRDFECDLLRHKMAIRKSSIDSCDTEIIKDDDENALKSEEDDEAPSFAPSDELPPLPPATEEITSARTRSDTASAADSNTSVRSDIRARIRQRMQNRRIATM
ncbi:MAG: hypothetical protein MHM6MM_000163 [Cercozoa sp. M6MM]